MVTYEFNIGDKVKLKDGDGRIHIIESFEKTSFRNSICIKVVFTDNSAVGWIFGDSYNPNNYYANIIKVS